MDVLKLFSIILSLEKERFYHWKWNDIIACSYIFDRLSIASAMLVQIHHQMTARPGQGLILH